MATFSLAFILIGFEWPYEESIVFSSGLDIRVRTFSDPQTAHNSVGVHRIVWHVLEFYMKIFSLPHSLQKLDVVVAPDISMGAKGNYGLIFMRYVIS